MDRLAISRPQRLGRGKEDHDRRGGCGKCKKNRSKMSRAGATGLISLNVKGRERTPPAKEVLRRLERTTERFEGISCTNHHDMSFRSLRLPKTQKKG